MDTGRLLIVSNRLPVATRIQGGQVSLVPSSGGLATGLQSWRRGSDAVWIGWPGDVGRCTAEQRNDIDTRLAAANVVPVWLSHDDVNRYYEGFANRVLWPLFHYQVDRVPVDATGWEAYRHVNLKFADAVAGAYQPGDIVWVHDYQLMLVPAMLRQMLPDARIGFFLHIPFPSSEVFRILPWRSEILRGLLGADLIGFHTFAYLRHFSGSLVHVDGIETDIDRVRVEHRSVRLGAFPMSVDVDAFQTLARDPDVTAEAASLREDAGGRRILLGVDRLDYTKGIPRRLLAIERLLARQPELRDAIRYIQVAVPSRGRVDAYQAFRREVEEAVGRINGACATLRSMPVHYLHQSVSPRQLAALYCAADVMLVTPLRDGMNLVAKEFVASRVDEDGVLVLSEFAGAAAEFGEAVVVNPYDVDATAQAISRALTMPQWERRTRIRGMRARVAANTVHHWASRFIDCLKVPDPKPIVAPSVRAAELSHDLEQMRAADELTVVLDYDGTLVPIAPAPDLAIPDANLLEILRALCERPGTRVHVVTGRTREFLDRWFADVPSAQWAEHGFWFRAHPGEPWTSVMDVPMESIERVRPILDQFTADTPGSLIEIKSASIAWHYRAAHPEFGLRQAHELRMLLGEALSNQPLEVIEGRKVIEVRLRGVTKALVARRLAATDAVLAIGDDQTDDELFAALPASAVTLAVGSGAVRAKYAVRDPDAAREALRSLCDRHDSQPRSSLPVDWAPAGRS